MKKILQYNILEKLEETRGSILYRVRKENEDKTFILKELKSKDPTPSEIARFKQEYNLIRKIDIDGVIKTYEILEYDNKIALVLEDFNGISLENLDKKMELKLFLLIAINLSNALGHLHKETIVHKDIKPRNILFNTATEELRISGFGISNEITHENNEINAPAVITGSLVYMSPEQTGRMNRQLDYRTDMYSLGITLYELLTGRVPFRSTDPMELIHHHIAINASPPAELNPAVPKTVSNIVMKLLSKMPEERYQNCFGVMTDLQECLRQLENTGKIKAFEPGQYDIAPGFIVPRILAGRERELDVLMNTVLRITSSGERSEFLLVSGEPGIGKSVLINEAHRLVMSKQGYFIWGKYDQYRRDVPYSAIIQAFQGLVNQVLSESSDRIRQWKEDILQALGPNGKVITDVIPEIELIIGEQPEIPELGPEQNQNRFNYTCENFAAVLATKDHPVVLFLDDLQWVDTASLKLIHLVTADNDIDNFLIIGAYRDNEVDASHPLMVFLDTIQKEGVPVNSIHLDILDPPNVNLMISSFLRCDKKRSLSLAELIHQKTNGNPFFVNQFMKTLYDENLLRLDPALGWQWDMAKIEEMQITDNVVELMAQKMTKLPQSTREIMKICACIGNRFDPEIPSKVVNRSIAEVLKELTHILNEGMIRLQDDLYRFQHDRIQEAAYSLVPEEEKEKLHRQIGTLMLETTKEEDLHDKIIYIVDQFNRGKSLVQTEENRYRLARLNLGAGIKAKGSTAYQSALIYFKTGIDLIDRVDAVWQKQYDLSLSLYTEAAEAAYLYCDYNEMELFSEEVLKEGQSLPDKSKVYEIKIQAYMAQNRLLEAITTGTDVLKSVGIGFPKKPGKFHILTGLIKTMLLFKGKKRSSLLELPVIKDPLMHASLRLLSRISSVAYWVKPGLFPLIIFRIMNIIIKFGNSKESPYSYSGYGMMLCSIGKIDSGYEFGKLALTLVERMNARDQVPRTHFVVNTFIRHWKEHLGKTIEPLRAGFQKGLEIGDLEFAAHSAIIICSHLYFLGSELKGVEYEMLKFSAVVKKIEQKTQLQQIQMYHQVVWNLLGTEQAPYDLKGTFYNEEEMKPVHRKANDRTAMATLYSHKAKICYLFNNYTGALENLKNYEIDLDALRGNYNFTTFYFYDSLTRLALYDSATRLERKKIMRKVAKNQKKIKTWMGHNPSNHTNKFYLVEAEGLRVQGNNSAAVKYYNTSIRYARENGFIQEEGIANECAGRFWLSKNEDVYAQIHMQAAVLCYSRWGAAAKVIQLKEKYGSLLQEPAGRAVTGSTTESLDLSTVMKAARAISGEIVLEKLLEKMIRLVLENAGAQKGLLFLRSEADNKLYIEAQGTVNTAIRVLESIPLTNTDTFSTAIVNYVSSSKKDVLLSNASSEGKFTGDPYIKKNKIKSILCGPIMHKGKVSGILYLENNLTTNAFPLERLKLLRLLSSQAAISIDNARLVSVEKRKAALEKEIEMARDIQISLLPQKIPNIQNADVSYKYEPMMEVGGDFLDVHYDAENNRLCLFVCDVVGHGVYASLLASMAKIALQTWKKENIHPKNILTEMWNQMAENIGDNFITACVCSLDLDTGKLAIASAGHPPLIIIKNDGSVELIKAQGKMINNIFEPQYEEREVQLQADDTVILYTDGISEAENKDGEMIGANYDEKFCQWIRKYSDMSTTPEELCENIYRGVIEHTGGKDQEDDFTILIARYSA
ncbi:MAG: SpoIIE family protein phosphatase [bacterium]|nr:SpoIIE family protein phosphatase [bacterium]